MTKTTLKNKLARKPKVPDSMVAWRFARRNGLPGILEPFHEDSEMLWIPLGDMFGPAHRGQEGGGWA